MTNEEEIPKDEIFNDGEESSDPIDDSSDEDFYDDEESTDDVIEITDDELSDDIYTVDTKDGKADVEITDSDVSTSKHKQAGKHSLAHDSIFKGKKEDPLEETDSYFIRTYNDSISVDVSTSYHHESIDNETYIREKLIKERVYDILTEFTEINFLNNRRKPSRSDFNYYFGLLKANLEKDKFTNVEIFNELSVYFSDNLFNMFKLLDNNWRNLIINELQDHIGKRSGNKDLIPKNLVVGTLPVLSFIGDISCHLGSQFSKGRAPEIQGLSLNSDA